MEDNNNHKYSIMNSNIPSEYLDKTNGYILKRYKTFSDNSKWFLGGITGMLLFAYDKMGVVCEIIGVVLAFFGVLCFTYSFAAFKKAADDLEDRIERDELLNAPFSNDKDGKKPLRDMIYNRAEWPGKARENYYKPGLIICMILAVFVFGIAPFFNVHKENCASTISHNCGCCTDLSK